jgi:hypothetical protein
MKLAREETKIMVTGRSFYRKNNLKFKGMNRNLNRNWNQTKKTLGPGTGTWAKWHSSATLVNSTVYLYEKGLSFSLLFPLNMARVSLGLYLLPYVISLFHLILN